MSQITSENQHPTKSVIPLLSTKKLGSLPIIRLFLNRLKVREIIDAAAPKPGALVSNGDCIEALIMAVFIDQQHALSRVSEVLSGYDLEQLFRPGVNATLFHDTRLGEALDDLCEKAPSIYGDIVGQGIREFQLRIRQMNMDITRVLLHGEYQVAEDFRERHSDIAIPEHGWNPHERWDLKQLLFNLIVTEDKLPLMYSLGDGNACETTEYLHMMERLDTIQADVSKAVLKIDSKGCDAKTLMEAAKQKLRLVTLVPETYSLQERLREFASQREMKHLFTTEDGDQYYGLSIERPMLIDFVRKREIPINKMWRYLVVFSSDKAARAAETRECEISEEREKLGKVVTKFSQKKLFACRQDAEQEANAMIKGLRAKHHKITWKAQSGIVIRGRGRPLGSGLKANDKTGWGITFSLEAISRPIYRFDPEGMFVLLSTVSDNRILSDTDILLGYKGRNVVEISFNWLKGDAAVAPMFLKKPSRIQAMGFVFVVWMLIYGLIQREIRKFLKMFGGECPHPDNRMVHNPTTRGVLALFDHVCLSTCHFQGQTIAQIQLWRPELDRILELLGAKTLYEQYSRGATL